MRQQKEEAEFSYNVESFIINDDESASKMNRENFKSLNQ